MDVEQILLSVDVEKGEHLRGTQGPSRRVSLVAVCPGRADFKVRKKGLRIRYEKGDPRIIHRLKPLNRWTFLAVQKNVPLQMLESDQSLGEQDDVLLTDLDPAEANRVYLDLHRESTSSRFKREAMTFNFRIRSYNSSR